MSDEFPWRGKLCLTGWHGYSEQPVLVVGETPKRWRIEAIEATQLPGHGGRRVLQKGERTLVPRYAVRRDKT